MKYYVIHNKNISEEYILRIQAVALANISDKEYVIYSVYESALMGQKIFINLN